MTIPTSRLPSSRSAGRARAIAAPAPQSLSRAVWIALASLLVMSVAVVAAPYARAQVFSATPYTPDPDPAVERLRIRLEALEADLKRAVDRAETLGAQLSDARRIADEANAGRKAAETRLAALETRIEALEARPTPAVADAAPGAGPAVDLSGLPQDEPGLFQQSQTLLTAGNYAAAQGAFAVYIDRFPKGPNVADAHYYLAEALLYQDNYADAATAYGDLIKTYPKSENAPTGLVKLARAMRLMGKPAEACKALSLMSKQFPKASAVAKQLAATERQNAKCK